LAAALAAGETPSPDVVAAARDVGLFSPAVSLTCVAVTVIGLLSLGVVSPHTMLLGMAGIDKEPAALVERARTIARNLGYENRPVDEAYGYESDLDYLRYVRLHNRSPSRWDALKTSRPTGVTFWYRQSRSPMTSMTFRLYGPGHVGPNDPEETQPGMLSMRIDSSGRLVRLFVASGSTDVIGTASGTPDWARVFAESGLPMAEFSRTSPQGQPANSGETRVAWEGTNPDHPDMAFRVEAAAAKGRLVFFDAFPPSVRANQEDAASPSAPADSALAFVNACVAVLVWAGASLLARRNMRQGRGDRRGAFRLSVYIAATSLLANTIGAHHPAGFVREIELMRMLLTLALSTGIASWLMYMAIEPHLRRVWPEVLIGWSRVLTGRVRDPRVGRDLLIGACTGILIGWVPHVAALAPRWVGLPGPILGVFAIGYLPMGQLAVSARHGLEFVLFEMVTATFLVLVLAVALVFFRILLRSRTAAALALVVLFALTGGAAVATQGVRGGEWVLPLVGVAINAALLVLVLVRFGVLSMIAAVWVSLLNQIVPVTFDWSAPYAESSWLIVGTILALTFYGFRTTLAGRPIAVTRFELQP
jgi:hypothetical protein